MHNGNKSLAYELIRQAKLSGATIAKFQLGWTREAEAKYAPSPAPIREDNKCSARYIDDWTEDLARWCADMDIEFMASIWSIEGLEVARSVGMKRYKIAHQMDDAELVSEMCKDNKELFVSSSAGGQSWHTKLANENFRWVYADADYPHHGTLLPTFDFLCGFSSHRHGIADALVAVYKGAKYIEKHITLDKTMPWPRDASFALLPHEFEEMTRIGNEIARLR